MNHLIFYGYEFLVSFIPFLIILILFRYSNKKKERHVSKCYYAAVVIFAFYIIGVYHFTGVGTLYDGLTYQLVMKQNQLNFIPFSHAIDINAYLLNILLFIPFGILLPFIWRKINKPAYIAGAGFAFSFFIELSQLLNNRRSDIDDLILNTLGAMIGFALYKIWCKCTKREFQLGFVPAIELPIYIIVIFAGRFLLYNEIGLAGLLYGF